MRKTDWFSDRRFGWLPHHQQMLLLGTQVLVDFFRIHTALCGTAGLWSRVLIPPGRVQTLNSPHESYVWLPGRWRQLWRQLCPLKLGSRFSSLWTPCHWDWYSLWIFGTAPLRKKLIMKYGRDNYQTAKSELSNEQQARSWGRKGECLLFLITAH